MASPIVRIHGSRNQGVEMGMISFTIIPRDQLEKSLILVPVSLSSVGLEVLVPDGVGGWGSKENSC